MAKSIVTGSSGFLGTTLCAYLEQKGHTITRLSSSNCDLRKADSLDAFNNTQYDYLFHLAAWTQAGDFCLSHPGEQWIINQLINTHVLKWWQASQPQATLVFMGTSCVYAEGSDLREDDFMRGEPIDSLYTYAMTKRMLYQGARALNKQYGLRYICAVPSTLYGADYHTDGRQMHFIFDLIRKIIRAKELDEPVTLWGDGSQRREIVHVLDFASILWELMEHKESANSIFNIGAGEEHTIRHFAEEICSLVGFPSEHIKYDTTRYVGAKSKCLNVEKAKHLLGADYQLRPLRVGLKDTIDWFYKTQAYML